MDASDPAVSLFASRDGGFVPVLPSLPTGTQPVQVLSADLDGNGRDDLVVRNAGDGTLSLYLGDGQGGFLPRIDLPAPGASDVSLADLDHSGRLDILLADETSGDVRILHNLGGGAFTPPTIWRGAAALTGWATSRVSRASPRGRRPRAWSRARSGQVAPRTSWPSTPARTPSAS